MNFKTETLQALSKADKQLKHINYTNIEQYRSYKLEKIVSYGWSFDIEDLDFEYTPNCCPSIFGYIVFDDNTWLERTQLNETSNEQWVYRKPPSLDESTESRF